MFTDVEDISLKTIQFGVSNKIGFVGFSSILKNIRDRQQLNNKE